MIKAIIFDCFGVLITDALEAIVTKLRETEPEKASQIVATIVAANRGVIPSEISRATIAGLLGITVDEYSSRLRSEEVKNQPLLDYIAGLRPKYKTAILSNTSSKGLTARFTDEELTTHFDVVIASGQIGYAKPEAQAYEIAAGALRVRLDECVMIDDREEYCAGARGVGMQTILYADLAQAKQELQQILTQSSDGAGRAALRRARRASGKAARRRYRPREQSAGQ